MVTSRVSTTAVVSTLSSCASRTWPASMPARNPLPQPLSHTATDRCWGVDCWCPCAIVPIAFACSDLHKMYTRTQKHTSMHTLTRTHMHTHAHANAHAHVYAHAQAQASLSHTHSHTHRRTTTRTHTHRLTGTHEHTHNHRDTHTLSW